MINKILVAYDAEDQSQKALDAAVEIAKKEEAEIFVLTSIKVPEYLSFGANIDLPGGGNIDKIIRENYEKKLADVAAKIEKEGVPVKTVFFQENPGDAVVKFSEKENIDLVVVGSHNRAESGSKALQHAYHRGYGTRVGGSRALLGSVSNYIVQNAACAVMVIKA